MCKCQWTQVTPPVVNHNYAFHPALNSSRITHSSERICALRRVHCVKWWQGGSDGQVGLWFVFRHVDIDSGIESAAVIHLILGSLCLAPFFSFFWDVYLMKANNGFFGRRLSLLSQSRRDHLHDDNNSRKCERSTPHPAQTSQWVTCKACRAAFFCSRSKGHGEQVHEVVRRIFDNKQASKQMRIKIYICGKFPNVMIFYQNINEITHFSFLPNVFLRVQPKSSATRRWTSASPSALPPSPSASGGRRGNTTRTSPRALLAWAALTLETRWPAALISGRPLVKLAMHNKKVCYFAALHAALDVLLLSWPAYGTVKVSWNVSVYLSNSNSQLWIWALGDDPRGTQSPAPPS